MFIHLLQPSSPNKQNSFSTKKKKHERRKREFQHRNFINLTTYFCSIRLAAGVWGLKCHLPHAHMSTGFPYGSFLRTSGDKYPGVPANPGKVIWRSEVLVIQRASFPACSHTFVCNYQLLVSYSPFESCSGEKQREMNAHQTKPAGRPAPR